MVESLSFLNSAQRTLLDNSQRIRRVQEESANRISTGRRVNQVNDNPVDYFNAKALIDKVADLGELKGDIGLSRSTVEPAVAGLDAINEFSRQLKGIANAAKTAETQAERDALSTQFDQIRNQINSIAEDTSFLGVNLIGSSGQDFSTQVGLNDASSYAVERTVNSSTALGIGESASYNGFATLSDINDAISDIDSAISQVRVTQNNYGSDIAALNIHENFTENFSTTLQGGVDKLVNANLTEEAAVQLSAQVRNDLSFQGQKILAQGDSLLMGLFK